VVRRYSPSLVDNDGKGEVGAKLPPWEQLSGHGLQKELG